MLLRILLGLIMKIIVSTSHINHYSSLWKIIGSYNNYPSSYKNYCFNIIVQVYKKLLSLIIIIQVHTIIILQIYEIMF
jgi:hypothetical protein